MTMNKVLVIGNLGSDPEMRYTPNGNPVTSFRIATNRRYTTSEGEQREETEWFTVSAWNRLAETCNQFLTKGRKVYVEGRLKSSPWIGNDGEPRAGNEIVANDVRFIDSRAPAEGGEGGEAGEAGGAGGAGGAGADDAAAGAVEDLPW